jgi:hypothetical protein
MTGPVRLQTKTWIQDAPPRHNRPERGNQTAFQATKKPLPGTQETAIADKANVSITYQGQALVQWFAARDLFKQVSG